MDDRDCTEFDLVWRGYDRRQVDRCFEQLEGKLIEALAEREMLAEMPAELAAAKLEIDATRRELTRLHALGTASDTRVLSVKMEAILGIAEAEAIRLREQATAELAAAELEAVRIREEANERALEARRDFELALRGRREKEKQADLVLKSAAEAEAREIVAAAHVEAARIVAAATATPRRAVKPAPQFMRWFTRRRRARAWA